MMNRNPMMRCRSRSSLTVVTHGSAVRMSSPSAVIGNRLNL
jgi:hypothetical protein